MNCHCLNAALLQLAHLILHQRNERRNNNTDPIQQQSRNLETNGFPAASRKQRQCIGAFQHRPYYVFLEGSEGSMAPVFL